MIFQINVRQLENWEKITGFAFHISEMAQQHGEKYYTNVAYKQLIPIHTAVSIKLYILEDVST